MEKVPDRKRLPTIIKVEKFYISFTFMSITFFEGPILQLLTKKIFCVRAESFE
jgi:hypothetical protein